MAVSKRRKKNRKKYEAAQAEQASLNANNPTRAQKRNGLPFWGDDSLLPSNTEDILITDDPAAVPRSLGHPPMPGNEQMASHYFEAVHTRAVQFGAALAAAAQFASQEG